MNFARYIAGAATALCSSFAAQAGVPAAAIHELNAAIEAGVPATVIAAADALIAVALEHPGDPNAISAAFEAGTHLCLNNACPRAAAAAPLMKGANTEDVTPALANLLVVYADWSSAQNKATDKAMMEALQAVAPETPTYLTISAFDRYHLTKLQANDLSELRKVAELAAGHLKPVWSIVPVNWASMELSAIATSFARDRNTDVIDRLAKLEVAIYPFLLDSRASGNVRPEIESLYYQTYAWRYATEAFFKSRGTRTASALKAANEYVDTETRKIGKAFYKDRERRPAKCTGGFRKAPEPTYPASALRDGYVGAVIVGFDVVDGKMENARVLAAVPDRQFEDAVLKSMKPMEWYFDEVQKNPDCSRDDFANPGGIIPFMFNRGSRAFVSKD